MTLTFRYKKVKRPNNTEVKSPSIPIILSGNGGKYQFMALLDSGADMSVIPEEVAELLGLDLSGNKEEAQGIGGKVNSLQTSVNLELGKPHEIYTFSLPVKVIFTKDGDNEQELPILLGRAGFFDKFVITFNQSEERILLKRTSENSLVL